MADRKLSALVALTAPTIDDELYIIDAGVPKRVRMDNMSIDGTFTPTLYGSTTAGAQTYAAQFGYYSRIGKLVHFTLRITLSAFDALSAGDLRIGGLPFSSFSVSSATIGFQNAITKPANTVLACRLVPGGTYIELYSVVTNTTTASSSVLSVAALTSTLDMIVSGSFRTS